MECRPYGDRGVLLSVLSDDERIQLCSALNRALPAGCSEFVSGQDSILLVGRGLDDLSAWLDASLRASNASLETPRTHQIPVRYDGADLESVAKTCGMPVSEVIERHSAPIYTVRMMGFSPGFSYLDGLDPKLHLDRRPSPRNHIAPGSVAIGGSHAGIYSVASPGGWHLLGNTEWPLFNLEAAKHANPNPATVFALSVGDRVHFQPFS